MYLLISQSSIVGVFRRRRADVLVFLPFVLIHGLVEERKELGDLEEPVNEICHRRGKDHFQQGYERHMRFSY